MGADRLALLLSIDNMRPQPGSDVDFNLTTANRGAPGAPGGLGATSNIISDIDIQIRLSSGLEFKTGWTPPSSLSLSGTSATWRPAALDLNARTARPRSRNIEIQTQLTTDTLDQIPLDQRCITAWVKRSTPPPPTGYPFGSIKQCLGDDPPVLFQDGPIAIFTSFPCNTQNKPHQCQSNTGVAIAARVPSTANLNNYNTDPAETHLRSYGIGRRDTTLSPRRGQVFVDPEAVFIQVKDPQARVKDSNVNKVSAVSWQTARTAHADIGNRTIDGVTTTITSKDITDDTAWNSLGPRAATVTGTGGASPPGDVKIRVAVNGVTFLDLSSPSYSASRPAFSITSVRTSVTPYFADFQTLGTYLLTYSITMTDSSNVQHTDSARYTFHVGPVAELETKDAGTSPEVPSDQQAFTISAINNGPDTAPAAQVTVTGLDDTYVSHSVTAGTFDPTTGIWQIGELKETAFYQAVHDRDGETLSIITSAASNATVTARITNTQDYQVCINSDAADVTLSNPSSTACTAQAATNTWHTAKYYDYIPANNSTTITATTGTAASLTETTPAPEVNGTPESIIVLTWPAVKTLKGQAVSHYQVEKWVAEDEEWERQEPDKVLAPMWLDDDPGEDPQYRVRAVNEAKAHGPWSETVFGERNIAEDAGVEVDLDPNTDGPQRSKRVEEGDEIEYTIKLKSRPSFAVHVEVEADDSLTVITPATPVGVPPLPNADHVVTFHPSEWETAKRVKVKVNDDLVIGAARTAKIRHRLPGAGGINRIAGYAGVTVRDLTLTVNDVTYQKAGFQSLGEKTLLLAVGETQSYEIRPLVRPTADMTVTVTSPDTTVVTIGPDLNTTGEEMTITLSPDEFRAERDTETRPGTEFYAVPVNEQGPGVVYVTATGAGDAEITISSVDDSNFSQGRDGGAQKVKVGATKPVVTAPEFSTPPVNRTATVGAAFSYTPAAATDAQGDTITYAATLTGGSPLPGWLTFTPSSRTFAGTPQVCDGPAALPITITATDDSAPIPQTGSDEFTLTVNGVSGGPAWHETVSPAYYEEYARQNGHLGEGGNPDPAYYNRPPLFLDGESITLSLAENSAADVKVGKPLTACDPDGSPLLYKYLDGADSAAFSLDEDTGQLTTVSGHTYDYDTDPSYEFLVIVEEQGSVEGWLSAISVTVNVSEDD